MASSPRIHIGSESPNATDGLPTPVWLRESSKSFHWKWVPLPFRTAARFLAAWTKGPDPPGIQRIRPFLPAIQEAPAKFIDKHLPRNSHKAALLGFLYFGWLLTFSLVLHRSASAGNIRDYGRPTPIWCGANLWSVDNGCGLSGNGCRPFQGTYYTFRCSANCASTMVLNPRAVGDREINYSSFVIGGPRPGASSRHGAYRADSFICQAAIHAGVIGNQKGGCGVVRLVGEQSEFYESWQHGIGSIRFNSTFPKSYDFLTGLSSDCVKDLRWPLLAVTLTFTAVLSICTTSPPVFFWSTFVMLFFHVGLVSDPPISGNYLRLSSMIIGRFLPAAFVAFVLYRYAVSKQLSGLTASLEKTILWLGGAWVGALNNYTFGWIPIERLTPHDLRVQPGARLALIIIILLLFSIALGQVWYLRLEGRLRRYLAIYAIFVAALLVGVALPRLNLRIHHYFLAILLLPGTRVQTRPGLLYQGILVGLFINGTARWGFDSILQTTAELRGDGPLMSALPNVTVSAISKANLTFVWAKPPPGYDGISVLVNDVERHRWYYGEGRPSHTFYRYSEGHPEYFRFGYMSGSSSADFTRAGTWRVDGTWNQPS